MFIQAIFGVALLEAMWADSIAWTITGFAAQGLFSARFLVQWISSEKHKRVMMPVQFWYFSIAGGWLNLLYAIHLWKMPLLFGAIASLLTSHRNLHLHRKAMAAPPTQVGG